MHPKRKKRLYLILFLLLGTTSAFALTLYALKQNLNFYYTPTEIHQVNIDSNSLIRLGGLVKTGTIHYGNGLLVNFVVTDGKSNIKVIYNGVLPDLFKENQGIVVQGRLNTDGLLLANQVLAKHGADYKPPYKRSVKIS